MADMTFTTRHSGASVTCTGGLTMVHLFSHVPSEVEIVDSERGPVSVKVTKIADRSGGYESAATVVHLDWETAQQVAELVSHRLEQADHEGDPGNPGAFCEHDSGSHCPKCDPYLRKLDAL